MSRVFGTDRGLPIDRYYIEQFLGEHGRDIRGRVLEIGDDTYTRKFGEGVSTRDVLHVTSGNERATIVADLSGPSDLPAAQFDCVIVTQTLQFILNGAAAVRELHRLTASGGVLLVTVPCISQISRYDADRWGEYWRYTSAGLRALLEPHFREVEVTAFGNVLSAIALLEGLAAADLRREELDSADPDYEVIVAARAVK